MGQDSFVNNVMGFWSGSKKSSSSSNNKSPFPSRASPVPEFYHVHSHSGRETTHGTSHDQLRPRVPKEVSQDTSAKRKDNAELHALLESERERTASLRESMTATKQDNDELNTELANAQLIHADELSHKDRTNKVLQTQLEELTRRESTLQGDIKQAQDQLNELLEFTEKLQRSYRSSTEELEGTKAQLQALRQEVAHAVGAPDFKTDDDLRFEVTDLFNDIQAWALTVMRGAKIIEIEKTISVTHWLRDGMPHHDQPDNYHGGKKRYLLCCLILLIYGPIMRGCDSNAPFWLGDVGPSKLAACLSQACPDGVDYAKWKAWLCTTRDLLLVENPDFLDRYEEAVVQANIRDIAYIFAKVDAVQLSPSMMKGLGRIFSRAFNLTVTLHFHPARYRLERFPACDWIRNEWCPFQESMQEDMANNNIPAGQDIALRGCSSPALVKYSDEKGHEIETKIISKAKVLTNFVPDDPSLEDEQPASPTT